MDEVDRAQRYQEQWLEQVVAQAARGVLIPGEPGECELCGEWSGRLVHGVCAPCRDRHQLP